MQGDFEGGGISGVEVQSSGMQKMWSGAEGRIVDVDPRLETGRWALALEELRQAQGEVL